MNEHTISLPNSNRDVTSNAALKRKERKKEGSNVKRKEETGAATIVHVGASSSQGHFYEAWAL